MQARVFLLTEPLYPHHIGGGGLFSHNLVCGLAARGIAPTVVCPSRTENRIDSSSGFDVHWVQAPFDSWEPRDIELRIALFARYIEERFDLAQFDLIHDLGGWYFNPLIPRLKARSGRPILVQFQLVIYNLMKAQGYADHLCRAMNSYQKVAADAADHLIFISQGEADIAGQLGLRAHGQPVSIVPNGLRFSTAEPSPDALEELRREKALPKGPLILFAGRTSDPVKGAQVAFRAFRKVAAQVSDATLVVASPDRTFFEELGEMEDRARHVGWLAMEEMALLYHLASIVIVPSQYESLGQVAIEAMNAGRPVIASGVGGLLETIEDGVTGLILRSEDRVTELAEKLLYLLLHPDEAREMGKRATPTVRNRFSIDHVTDRILDVYRTLLAVPIR
jgi:D-inositol-3-phosphate glycosyltransferase